MASLARHGSRRRLGIRLAQLRPPEPEWCWRDDWVQGGESIYGLLAMFEALNAVGCRQLRDEFVDAISERQGRILRAPIVDLRSSGRLRLAKLSSALRLPIEQVRAGFVADAFPTSGWKGHTKLCWCPQCAVSGYHSTLFQLPVVFACPAHGCALERRCPRCRSDLPYRLDTSLSAPLFSCSVCRLDLCPAIRAGKRKAMSERQARLLDARMELMQFCDTLPTLTCAVLNEETPHASELLYSVPGLAVSSAHFKSFITRVLVSLRASSQRDLDKLEPSYAFVEPTSTHAGNKHSTKPRRSPSAGWPERVVPRSDRRLQRAAALYRCVRRYLWRRVIKLHRCCFTSTCRHLWWPIGGSPTSGLCPVATAFLRWRLKWETAAKPTALLSVPSAPPLGLVTWLASAPIGSSAWTGNADDWLVDHVLGLDLIATFDAMLNEEVSRPRTDATPWSREWLSFASSQCWVCVGRGTRSSPARLFVCGGEGAFNRDGPAAGKQHVADHLKSLSCVEH
jgi:hypothetical protein